MRISNVCIKDICSIKSGKRLPKGSDFFNGITPFPYIRARDIKNGRINDEELVYLSAEVQEKIKQYIVNTNDVVITIVGASVGDVAIVPQKLDGYNLTENAVRLTNFLPDVNPKYILYVLNTKKYWEIMQQIAGGSAQPKLGIYKIESIRLGLPDIRVQDKIVDILSTYDNLIENNQKQIKLLEEAAQRLYKEWFIDLRFPGYENTPVHDGVPEGWERKTIGELISYEIGGGWGEETPSNNADNGAFVIRGTDLYGLTHGNLTEIPFRYHGESNLAARMLQDGDIVFEVSGGSRTEGVARTALVRENMLARWSNPVMCASFCKLIRPLTQEYSQYLYDHFQYLRSSGKTEEYDKRSASSIVNYRWKDFLSQETILKPSRPMIELYNQNAATIYNTIIAKSIQIETAQNARDRLLPKLMSGEIEV